MASDVNVDFDAMRQSAARLETVHDEVVDALTTVASRMKDLEANGFSTPAASRQFQRLYTEWTARAQDLFNTMRETSEAIKSALQMHEEADRHHAEAARTAIAGAGVGAAGAGAGAVAAGGRGGGSGSGPGRPPRKRRAPRVKDPGYDVVNGKQAPDRIRNAPWSGRKHPDGAEYGYDRVPGPGGTPITRTQGMRVTVTKDMLRVGDRTTSPPQALKDTMPGYDSRYKLELGHLWADRLGGPNAARNFVPVHSHTNGGAMSYVEGRVAAAVRQHGRVELVALPRYVGNEPIPRDIFYAWRPAGHGSWTAVTIRNLPKA